MNAAEIIREIARRGHTVALEGETLIVRPPMPRALRERVVARKPEILAFFRELKSPAATTHIFVALDVASEAAICERGVCIACGIPWSLHGEPPARTWERTSNPDAVALIEATAIVQAAADRSTEDAR